HPIEFSQQRSRFRSNGPSLKQFSGVLYRFKEFQYLTAIASHFPKESTRRCKRQFRLEIYQLIAQDAGTSASQPRGMYSARTTGRLFRGMGSGLPASTSIGLLFSDIGHPCSSPRTRLAFAPVPRSNVRLAAAQWRMSGFDSPLPGQSQHTRFAWTARYRCARARRSAARELEHQMCDFGLNGLSSGRLPDRLDAL